MTLNFDLETDRLLGIELLAKYIKTIIAIIMQMS
jgi:hypothetical protein